MSDPQKEIYKAITKRVKKRFDRRKEFFSHLVGYSVTMAFIWGAWLNLSQFGEGISGIAAALVTVGWTIGIFIHGTQWYFSELEDRALERELERAGLYSGKLKNDERLVRLSDDGELLDLFDEEDTAEMQTVKSKSAN